jgi:hypothetical protein
VAIDGAAAFVAGANYCYVNGHPFAAFQAWIQGQEDLQPWLGWRHRLFWLDEWASSMAERLTACSDALPPRLPRPGIPGLAATTVVLRHDLDHSRDLSYLQEEVSRGLPATHGILKDSNTTFWRNTLAAHPSHECAFHYNTAQRHWMRDVRARLHRRESTVLSAKRAAVAGDGLWRQVQWARAHAVGATSLLRHMAFLIYPEWIDALDHVFDSDPGVLGGSSLFRAQVLRWGAERVDGTAGTIVEWPDVPCPLWFPVKMAHAADGGRLPARMGERQRDGERAELVDQILSHSVPHLPQRVITLGYHPAHARGRTFYRAGTLGPFRRVLDTLAAHGVQVEPLGRIFAFADAAVGEAEPAGILH